MEMCYDGALVMPSSYAIMNKEEMMYSGGGWCLECHWWGYNIYLTHKERQALTTGQTLVGLAAGLASVGVAAAIIGAYATIVWNYDDGYGVKIRVTGLGPNAVPTGVWSLSKNQQKSIAKKNKVIW